MSEPNPEPGEDVQAEQLLAAAVTAAATVPETQEQPAQPTQQPADAAPEPVFDATQWAALFGQQDPAEVKKQLDHARTWEKRAKDNKAAADKLNEIEESQKTEQQRLTDRLAAAERERDEERRGRARLMAAAAHNLPTSLIDRIGGTTEEEIDESAQALAAELERLVAARTAGAAPAAAPEPEPRPAPRRPVESLTPGAKPASAEPEDMDAVIRRMAGRGS